MVDCSRRGESLQQWTFPDIGGGYGPAAVQGGPAVVLGGSPGARTTTRLPWPPLELPSPPPAHQPSDGFGRYGVYSLFPGDVYTAPRYVPAPTHYHSLLPPAHKECVFSGYSAPVVDRGISQLQELMTKSKPVTAPTTAPAPLPDRRPKRRGWEATEVKQETGVRQSCACRAKTPTVSDGCSRTTPVTLKPQPQVKRETVTTPCQVAEVTTSAVKVKQEIPDPPIAMQGGIPVGIAVARQRSQERVKEDPVMPPLALLACSRPSNEQPVWAPPPAIAPPHHLWPAPIEQNVGLQPPMGYQLVRDPLSGQLLLLSNISDSVQRTIVWPNNTASYPSSPLLLPQTQPMTGHLLLDRLVTLATPTPPPPPLLDKRRPGLLKIDEPSLTGVMPCAKSSVVIQQLSTHTPLLNPQFSAIASSGSVLIQPTLHNTGSVLISAQQLTTTDALQNNASVVISHSEQDLNQIPLVLGGEFINQSQHFQIKESRKEEVPESVAIQVGDKHESLIGCRSQATSPAPCEEEVVEQADASNQTDSLPASSDEEETGVDLSGLELLSAASIEQIERSPLIEAPKIKTEVEDDDVVVEAPPALEVPPADIVIKEEVEPPEEERMLVEEKEVENEEEKEHSIVGGLGLLCDVAHRFIEEEEAASRPTSPCDNQSTSQQCSRPASPCEDHDNNSSGWNEADELTDDYKSPEQECSQRKSLPYYRPDSPCDPAELDMRVRLAELQRLYREKQRELSRLTPRKSISSDTSSISCVCVSDRSVAAKRGPGRPRKDTLPLKRPRSMSPPTSPPVLEPWSAVKCRTEGLPPPTLTPHKGVDTDTQQVEWELVSGSKSPPPLSPAESLSSSKKRKVGRPKKRVDQGSMTIVAKKARSKSSLVGLLLAKNSHKIKPKLKAEVKVKSWCEEEEIEWTAQPVRQNSEPSSTTATASTPGRPVKSKSLPTPNPKPHKKPIMVLAKKKRTNSVDQPTQKSSPEPLHVQGVASCQLTSEHLAPGAQPCRVLVAMGGLFYAGQLSAVRPPDLYGVTLDRERSHRPHIHSREEILKDSILEVCLDTIPAPGTRVCAYWSQQYRCLYPGTVPVASADDSDYDPRLVCVEFDDGDNGRISLEDIRLLPQDYPIVVYDPNPLQSLGKRRRRNSGASCDSQTKDKPNQAMEAVSEVEEVEPVMEPSEEPPTLKPQVPVEEVPPPLTEPTSTQLSTEDLERERRRLKKKSRKEKLRRLEGEKKHRHKHRDCLKSHRRKHKHRHHRHKHRHSKSDGDQQSEQGCLLVENKQTEDKKSLTLVLTTNPPILSTIKIKKDKKKGDRQGSVESRSKMAAFLPARQLWRWAGRGFKRPGARGRARKDFYRSIQRGSETITVGDCAVFLSTGRPDRPFIGRIESMWESWASSMVVKVRWFYHPEETVGCPETLPYPGALFESPHNDENDVQTISHKCEVLPLETYKYRLSVEPHRLATIYNDNDIYYLAGYYDPTNLSLRFERGVTDSQSNAT